MQKAVLGEQMGVRWTQEDTSVPGPAEYNPGRLIGSAHVLRTCLNRAIPLGSEGSARISSIEPHGH